MNIVVVWRGRSDAKAGEFARRYGWRAAAGGIKPRQAGLVLSKRFDADAIRRCLAAPFAGGVEVDRGGTLLLGGRFRSHLAAGGLGLSLRTDTAYHCEAARLFVDALCQRFAAHWAGGLELAVHEVVANGLIHGNLGLRSCGPGADDFVEYCRSLDDLLAHPKLIRRRLEVSAAPTPEGLQVAVRDEGAGYDPEAVRHEAVDPVRLHGLAVASAAARVAVEDCGRCTVLAFPRDGGAE